MKQGVVRVIVAAMLVGSAAAPAVAQEAKEAASKALPTLLIKGEVVSVDTNDPSAALLKVKDRYGFETPIYIKPDTTITKAGQAVAVADLSTGTALEVEYNFDINTAKRHAAKVTVNVPAATATATPPAAAPVAAAAPAPAVPAAPEAAAPTTSTPASDASTQEHGGEEMQEHDGTQTHEHGGTELKEHGGEPVQ